MYRSGLSPMNVQAILHSNRGMLGSVLAQLAILALLIGMFALSISIYMGYHRFQQYTIHTCKALNAQNVRVRNDLSALNARYPHLHRLTDKQLDRDFPTVACPR
jgi:membrane-anchored glycerophosphoryl diester phosphodiesterase (GDPDase)